MQNITKNQMKPQEIVLKMKEGQRRSNWGDWGQAGYPPLPIIFLGPKKSACRIKYAEMG